MNEGLGLDKAARLEAKRDEEAEAGKPRPLNPPFPFQAEPFDPEFFGVDRRFEPSGQTGSISHPPSAN
jgi:hypothetical protein